MVHASRNGSRHLAGSQSSLDGQTGDNVRRRTGDATTNWIDIVLPEQDDWDFPTVKRHDSWSQQQQRTATPNTEPQTVPLGDEIVAAIIPTRRRLLPRTPGLPIGPLATPERGDSARYVLTTIDARGRLADRSTMRVLQWDPGKPIKIMAAPGAVLVFPRPDGPDAITQQGHLRLPTAVRYSLGLKARDRLLVVGFPDLGFLVTYTMTTLDAMILTYHRSHQARPQP